VYYAATYGFTTVGAFGVVAVVERGTGGEALSDFAGLSRRAPVVSFCMLIFNALAGGDSAAGRVLREILCVLRRRSTRVPPDLGLLWLVILAVAMSAVSLYY